MEVTEALEAAIIRNAEFLADATLRALSTQYPETLTGEIRWHGAFLIEFAAVVQLAYWEGQEIFAHQKAGLPSYAEARQQTSTVANKVQLYLKTLQTHPSVVRSSRFGSKTLPGMVP